MIFNEQNTIENALRDHLCGSVKGEERSVKKGGFEIREDSAPYGSSFSPHPSSFFPPWKFVHGDDLILHGKQPQNVFVDTWLKEFLCRLNKPLAVNPDLADEVIHRMRGVLLATNLKRDTFRHFGSMAIPQSSKI